MKYKVKHIAVLILCPVIYFSGCGGGGGGGDSSGPVTTIDGITVPAGGQSNKVIVCHLKQGWFRGL